MTDGTFFVISILALWLYLIFLTWHSMKNISLWMKIIIYILTLQYIISTYNRPLTYSVFLLLNIICAEKCLQIASKRNKNKNLAYFIGWFFSIIGLFNYWIITKKDLNIWLKIPIIIFITFIYYFIIYLYYINLGYLN